MSALFNEPVRAHVKTDIAPAGEPCLWVGLTSKDEALLVLADGTLEAIGMEWVTADWRWTGHRWEDLQEALGPQEDVDPDGT